MLIDDIFDTYHRLSNPEEVFDEAQAVQVRTGRFRKQAVGEDALDDVDIALLTLETRTTALERILSWRRAEIIVAESFSRQVGSRFAVLGVKHPLTVLALLLKQDEAVSTVYISHQITNARRFEADNGHWPDFVHEINRLPAMLAARHLVGIMPTAIDEYRFIKFAKWKNFERHGTLSPRWPLIQSDHGLIAQPPISGGAGLEASRELFREDRRGVASGIVRVLENAISDEVPFRDHLLVDHNSTLLAFRPRAGGSNWSGGVRAELAHIEQLIPHDEDRRILIIHRIDDVERVVSNLFDGDGARQHRLDIHDFAWDAVEAELARLSLHAPSRSTVRRALIDGLPVDDLLETAVASEARIIELRDSALELAVWRVLHIELTCLNKPVRGTRMITYDGDFGPDEVERVHSAITEPLPSPEDSLAEIERIVRPLLGERNVSAWAHAEVVRAVI